MRFGLDLLGLGEDSWKVNPTIKVFPDGFGLGVFGPKVFGDPMRKVRALLKSGKVGFFRLQLIYQKSHQFPTDKYIKQEVPRWNELATEFSNIDHFLSPCCEYENNDKNKILDVMSLTRSLAPNCSIVQSPGRINGKVCWISPQYLVEEHGNQARTGCDGLSTDGENAYDMCDQGNKKKGVESWIERHSQTANYCFLWGARFNLAEAHNTLPPMQRFAAPEPGYTVGVARLADTKPPVPVTSFPYVGPSGKMLLKTFAEDQRGNADKRENRPLFMLPVSAKPRPFVDLITFDRRRVARFRLFKDANPGRETDRYYHSEHYGWQLADKAMKLSGSPWCWLDTSPRIGPFHPAFRSPFFQVPK